MKLLCETTNNTMLMALTREGSLEADRPGVVVPSNLIHSRIANGTVILLGNLSDAATDVAFVETLAASKGDKELAIEAFMAEFAFDGPKKDQKAPDVLNGSDHLPAKIDINGETVALGDIVAGAFKASELSTKDWNEMPAADREKLLNAEIEARKAGKTKKSEKTSTKTK